MIVRSAHVSLVRAAMILTVFTGALAVGSTVTTVDPRRQAPGAPNVVWITIDTLRVDRLSSYGYERNTTPNLDRLIESGARFTQARTVEPLTNPALSSMVTSMYPHQHGGSRNGLRIRSGLASLPKSLQAHGYRTAAFVGNWTLRDKLSGLGEHFENYEEVLTRKRWFGLVRREANAEDVTEGTLTWIEDHQSRNRGVPFMVWAHYVEPHAPYRLHEGRLEQLGLSAHKNNLTKSDRYDTEIAYVDRSVGHLLAGLDRLAPGERTMIVFASDHGESLGEHKYWGHGRNLYEPTLRIPMSITWPGRIAPRSIESPALIIDAAPTTLGLLGLGTPESFEGYDWTDALYGTESPSGRITYYQTHRGAVISKHNSELSRSDGLLEVGVIHNFRKETYRIEKARVQVFDLATDRYERNNLGQAKNLPTEGLQRWMASVYAGLGSADEILPEPLDDESIEELRSLGYVE